MRAPLLTLLLVVLGWPALVVVLLSGVQWLGGSRTHPPARDLAALESGIASVSHPAHRAIAERALEAFRALAPAEQAAMTGRLAAAIVPLDVWLDRVDRDGPELICLGENHDDPTRAFLAEAVLPHLAMDVFALETTPRAMAGIHRRMRRAGGHVHLLGADIRAPLRAVRQRNPTVSIVGIEESPEQSRGRAGRGSREESIIGNFQAIHRPGRRHVVLLGALHCSERPGWFIDRIRRLPAGPASTLNVRVVQHRGEGPVEAFMHFLEQLELAGMPLVIAGAGSLPDPASRWFELLRWSTLDQFGAVVVYPAGPLRTAGSTAAPVMPHHVD